MIKKWFMNRLATIMKHNGYKDNMLTVEECEKRGKWTPCDLIAREYLNNGGGSSKGFLGLSTSECIKCYHYMCEVKQEMIQLHMVSEKAWNSSGFPLWNNHNFDR